MPVTTGLWGSVGDGARRPGSLCTGVPSLHHSWLTAGMVLQLPPRHNPQTTTTSLRKSLCSTAKRPGSSGPLFPQLTLGWAEASGTAESQRLSPATTHHPQPCDGQAGTSCRLLRPLKAGNEFLQARVGQSCSGWDVGTSGYWEIMGKALPVNALVLLQEHTDDEPIHLVLVLLQPFPQRSQHYFCSLLIGVAKHACGDARESH